jgi:serine/threonine protein kinase
MRSLRHPNIVEFLGVCYEENHLCIVTEFLVNGSLEDLLSRNLVSCSCLVSALLA